jgi:GNAT superfamily N-acetyltransferase
MSAIEITGALTGGRHEDGRALVFEYMAATVAETSGRAAPARIEDLPRVLRAECEDLEDAYSPPGTLLLAYARGVPAGCAGLVDRGERTAEVKRLYVRPAYRRAGIARELMIRIHSHAAGQGITTLLLDVMTSRTQAIGFYRRLGYAPTEPFPTTSPVPMVFMRRPVGAGDIRISLVRALFGVCWLVASRLGTAASAARAIAGRPLIGRPLFVPTLPPCLPEVVR